MCPRCSLLGGRHVRSKGDSCAWLDVRNEAGLIYDRIEGGVEAVEEHLVLRWLAEADVVVSDRDVVVKRRVERDRPTVRGIHGDGRRLRDAAQRRELVFADILRRDEHFVDDSIEEL